MTHALKILKSFADAKLAGAKMFEIRYNGDRGFQKGDKVKYTVMTDDGRYTERHHELNKNIYEITYVLNHEKLETGYVVFGEREIEKQK